MPEIYEILKPLLSILKKSKLENLAIIVFAILSMTGSKTMLNISRWTKEELSYRSIQRFFADNIPWMDLRIKLFMLNLFKNQRLIFAVDETNVTKSGKLTHGIDFFFNSIYQKVMKSLCFSCVSIIDVDKSKSYPLLANQLIFSDEEKDISKDKKEKANQAKGNKRGRKKGSKNNVNETKLPASFRLLKNQLEKCLSALKGKLSIAHLVADGFYGNSTVINICKDLGLFLISKLQSNPSIYYKFTGKYSGRGRKRIYGDKVDIKNLPYEYLVSHELKDNVVTIIYQFNCLHKQFKQEINTVIIIKENTKTNKVAKAIFFSTDLTLSSQEIIKFYSSRFQIEFNFRDAKEFFGLEDFMNVTESTVKTAVNISFFMVLLSQILLQKFRDKEKNPLLSIRDLISSQRAEIYLFQTLKLFRKLHPNILITETFESIRSIGRINL